jgi:hypothetical protein
MGLDVCVCEQNKTRRIMFHHLFVGVKNDLSQQQYCRVRNTLFVREDIDSN